MKSLSSRKRKTIGALLVCMGLCVGFVDAGKARLQVVHPVEAYSPVQLKADLYELYRQFPKALRIHVYGYSREGRPLYAAVAGDPSARYAVLMQGGLHAREHMTSLLVMAQLERLLRTGVPRDTCFHFLPMTNPDGVHISQQQTATAAQAQMYEEDVKQGYTTDTLDTYLRAWKANAAGVDLNRNFDAGWERIHTHPYPAGANYRGPYPHSEPESRALMQYACHRRFAATISYHATGSEIYYAFGQHATVNEQGRSLANALNHALHYEIKPDRGTSFGGFKDWAIEKQKTPSLTIEIGKEGTPLALHEFADIWRKNKDVPRLLARWVKE